MPIALWSVFRTAANAFWAAVQSGLTPALLACPITWIITAIIALIAVIAYVCYKVEGWGTLWSGVIGIMKYGFLSFVESIKLAFTAMTNGIMIGLDKIKIGWYKFKNAVGLGNKEENQAAIDRLDADTKQRKDKISEGADKVAEYTRLAAESARSIDLTWNNDKKLSDITDGFKKKLGIGDPSLPGMTEGDVPGGGGRAKALTPAQR